MLTKIAEKMSLYLFYLGMLSLIFMLLLNFVDVIGAKFFMWPLPGATEYTSLFQVVAISTAIGYTLVQKRHIRIEFIVDKFSKGHKKVINISVIILEMTLFIVCVWRGFYYGLSLYRAGEVGATSELPYYPFAFVLAFSGIPVLFILLDRLLKIIRNEG